jgi:NitT/TauT family transport system substrate-binding protein
MPLSTKRIAMTALAVVPLLTAAACSGGDDAPTTNSEGLREVTVAQSVDSLSFMSVYVAQAEGFYEDHGIDLEVTIGGTGGTETRALVAGQVPMAFSSGAELVKLAAQGRDVIAVDAINDRSVLAAVATTEAAEAAGFSDDWTIEERLAFLEGKRIAVTAPGSLTDSMARYSVQVAGLGADGANFVAAGTGAQQVAAIQQGKADAGMVFSPFTEQLVNDGDAVILFDLRQGELEAATPWVEQAVLTTPEFAEQNPDVVRGVAQATQEGNEWVLSHTPEEIAEVLGTFEAFSTLDPVALATSIEANVDTFSDTGEISADALQSVVDVLSSADVLDSPPEVDSLFDNSYLK